MLQPSGKVSRLEQAEWHDNHLTRLRVHLPQTARLDVSLEKPGGPKPPSAEVAALPAQPDGSRFSADSGQAFLAGGQCQQDLRSSTFCVSPNTST